MNLFSKIPAMLCMAFVLMCSCNGANAAGQDENKNTMDSTTNVNNKASKVLVETTAGNFTVILYDDTPKHRDNFLKLVREGYYNNTLFHRVIKDFMIQAGDPDSRTAAKGATLGAGGPDYKIDAEIVFPEHFHKRGALAAARQGDQVNPLRKSSGSQFYIVTGTKLDSTMMAQMERHMQQSKLQSEFNRLAMENIDSIRAMQARRDNTGLRALQDSLVARATAAVEANPTHMSDEMKTAYTTVGGAPHLDGDYTVFGEVIDGMDIIEKIEQTPTDGRDRPQDDIRILGMKIL